MLFIWVLRGLLGTIGANGVTKKVISMNFYYTKSMSIFFTRRSLLNMLWMFIFVHLLATPYFYEIHLFKCINHVSTNLNHWILRKYFILTALLETSIKQFWRIYIFNERKPLIEIDKYGLQFQYLTFSIHLHNEYNVSNVHKSLSCKQIEFR